MFASEEILGMNRYIQILAVLILMQIAVSVFVMWPKSADRLSNVPLIDLQKATITEMQLTDMENHTLSLVASANNWLVEQNGGSVQANNELVAELIKALTISPAGKPVSVSSESLSRFVVANEEFQWKIAISNNQDKTAVVYFGMPAGLNKRYVRRLDDANVYILDFSLTEKIVNVRDWLKRDLISLPKMDLLSITSNDYQLVNKNGSWQLANQSAKETVDPDIVGMFIARLSSLRVDGFVTGKLLADLRSEKPVQTIKILSTQSAGNTDADGEWIYEFYKFNDKNYLHRSDVEGYFEISILAAGDLLKLRNQWLIENE